MDSSNAARESRPGGSTPGAVGPSDVADEVKEVLRAVFDGEGIGQSVVSKPSESLSAGPADAKLDETGPIETLPVHQEKRRFRDIAREYDSRLRDEVVTSAKKAAPVPPDKAENRAKPKRVVITDEEVLKVKRTATKDERTRKKTRRRSTDDVARLPNRRWWTRTADGRFRLRWYSLVGVAVAALLIVLLLLTSPLLSIRNVVVEGNVYTNQARLDEIIADLKGDAILTADLHGATRQLEAIPWVRKARVSMHLPSRVVIQIEERKPHAFFRATDGFIRVVDREGRVLDVIEGDPVDFTRIIGTGPSLAPGDFVQQPFLGAVELVAALPVSLSDRLNSATVSPEGEISLQLSPNLLLIFGQPADFQVKLVAVVNEIKRQGTRSYTVIDVSTGEPNVR